MDELEQLERKRYWDARKDIQKCIRRLFIDLVFQLLRLKSRGSSHIREYQNAVKMVASQMGAIIDWNEYESMCRKHIRGVKKYHKSAFAAAGYIQRLKVRNITISHLQVLQSIPRTSILYRYHNEEFDYHSIQNLSWPQPPASYYQPQPPPAIAPRNLPNDQQSGPAPSPTAQLAAPDPANDQQTKPKLPRHHQQHQHHPHVARDSCQSHESPPPPPPPSNRLC